jgi:hypothetical protein
VVEDARRGMYWPGCFRGDLCLVAVEAEEEEHVEEVVVEVVVG